jgi:hypothetical protein
MCVVAEVPRHLGTGSSRGNYLELPTGFGEKRPWRLRAGRPPRAPLEAVQVRHLRWRTWSQFPLLERGSQAATTSRQQEVLVRSERTRSPDRHTTSRHRRIKPHQAWRHRPHGVDNRDALG